jgi:type II secretory pathway pseudopilin PulG
MKKRISGFTLVEMMVAVATAITVTSAALGVYLSTRTMGVEVAERNAMARDLQLALDLIERDLSYAGVGLPNKGSDPTAYGDPAITNCATSIAYTGKFAPHFRVAAADGFAVVGDLPLPNSDFNGVAKFTSIDGGSGSSDDRFSVSSEISGCTPMGSSPATSYTCDTRYATLIPDLNPTDLAAENNCTTSNPNERTCPWGMNKWQHIYSNDQPLLMVSGNSNWLYHSWAFGSEEDHSVGPTEFLGVHSHGSGACSGKNIEGDAFLNPFGSAFVSTPDRVFWKAVVSGGETTLQRRQCWGQPMEPDNVAFPREDGAGSGTAAGIATIFPTESEFDGAGNCDEGASPPESTGWETVVDGLAAATFDYYGTDYVNALTAPVACKDNDYGGSNFDPYTTYAANTPYCTLGQIKAVHVTLTASRTMPVSGKTLTQTAQRRIFITNRLAY